MSADEVVTESDWPWVHGKPVMGGTVHEGPHRQRPTCDVPERCELVGEMRWTGPEPERGSLAQRMQAEAARVEREEAERKVVDVDPMLIRDEALRPTPGMRPKRLGATGHGMHRGSHFEREDCDERGCGFAPVDAPPGSRVVHVDPRSPDRVSFIIDALPPKTWDVLVYHRPQESVEGRIDYEDVRRLVAAVLDAAGELR